MEFSKSDKAKAEFLLRPSGTHANTIENIRMKEYSYHDVVLNLTQFISSKRQKNDSTKEEPVGLKTKTIKYMTEECNYCQSKGRKVIGHIVDECWTKKKVEEKA